MRTWWAAAVAAIAAAVAGCATTGGAGDKKAAPAVAGDAYLAFWLRAEDGAGVTAWIEDAPSKVHEARAGRIIAGDGVLWAVSEDTLTVPLMLCPCILEDEEQIAAMDIDCDAELSGTVGGLSLVEVGGARREVLVGAWEGEAEGVESFDQHASLANVHDGVMTVMRNFSSYGCGAHGHYGTQVLRIPVGPPPAGGLSLTAWETEAWPRHRHDVVAEIGESLDPPVDPDDPDELTQRVGLDGVLPVWNGSAMDATWVWTTETFWAASTGWSGYVAHAEIPDAAPAPLSDVPELVREAWTAAGARGVVGWSRVRETGEARDALRTRFLTALEAPGPPAPRPAPAPDSAPAAADPIAGSAEGAPVPKRRYEKLEDGDVEAVVRRFLKKGEALAHPAFTGPLGPKGARATLVVVAAGERPDVRAFVILGEGPKARRVDAPALDGWALHRVVAVSFFDVTSDRKDDVILMGDYMTGIGEGGARPFRHTNVLSWKGTKLVRVAAAEKKAEGARTAKEVKTRLRPAAR